jgi:magnesium-transporting ATPase (P-type)
MYRRQVHKDADVPADMLFLAGSDKATDAAFVETASLDGETNLKQKECYKGTKAACTAAELAEFSARCYVKCARPNDRWARSHIPTNCDQFGCLEQSFMASAGAGHLRRLYEFDGVVAKLSGEPDRLEVSNLILRGCTLKNTDWVLGMVLFAGIDTKIFRNRAAAPRKASVTA